MLSAPTICHVCSDSIEIPDAAGYCRCGLGDLKTHKRVEKQISRQMLWLTAKFSMVMVPAILFLSQYHGFGTEILTLKMGSALGINSVKSQQELADLCVLIQRFDCATSAYQTGTAKNPTNLDFWLAWAKMETQHKNLENAIIAYRGYFQNGGTDNLIHYRFAKAQEDAGQTSEAITEYQKMLSVKTEVLQVTVAQNLVRLLIQEKRLDEAFQTIQEFQQQADNGKDYLNEELSQIQQIKKGQKPNA